MRQVHDYLIDDPRFRERRNKNRGIANLIVEKYQIEIPKDKRDDIVADILSMDRAWRKELEENVELRGTDYEKGKTLAQEWQLSNGYVPGVDAIIKGSNNIK